MWVLPTFWVVEWRQQILGSARFGILVLLLATWIFFQARRALCSEKGGSPGNVAVFISYCCCNESYPQITTNSGQKQNKTNPTLLYYILFWRSEVQNGFHQAKIKVLEGLCPFWKLQEESPFPCLFQHLDTAHMPWLVVSSSISKASIAPSLNLFLTLLPSFSICKECCDDTGHPWTIQANLSI